MKIVVISCSLHVHLQTHACKLSAEEQRKKKFWKKSVIMKMIHKFAAKFGYEIFETNLIYMIFSLNKTPLKLLENLRNFVS
jgi:hypothetical protein